MTKEEIENLSKKIDTGKASKSENRGYIRCNEDIKEQGLKWAEHMANLRWKCTGLDEEFSRGYTTRIYEEYLRKKQ